VRWKNICRKARMCIMFIELNKRRDPQDFPPLESITPPRPSLASKPRDPNIFSSITIYSTTHFPQNLQIILRLSRQNTHLHYPNCLSIIQQQRQDHNARNPYPNRRLENTSLPQHNPLISAQAISVKLAYLIPLLIQWNTQHPFPEAIELEQSHSSTNRNGNNSK
jgi:hypothetical protein